MLKVIDQKESKSKTIGERHIYTQTIAALLEKAKDGEIVTYEQMGEMIGMEVRPNSPGYSYQHSARTILERDSNIVFEVVSKIGLKRLAVSEVAKSSVPSFTKPLRSHIRRQKRRVGTLNDIYEKLEKEDRFQVDAARTLIAFTEHVTKRKSVNLIEDKVKIASKMIGFNDTVDLFTKKK